jgi:peptide/nickel transport system ATP-binding protein
MYLGRVVEEAPCETVFRKARHPYTQALLASVLTPEPGRGIPDTGLGLAFPDPLNPPPGCTFHPRCAHALARCASEPPKPRRTEQVIMSCHLQDSLQGSDHP